jgi:hypothetical protein
MPSDARQGFTAPRPLGSGARLAGCAPAALKIVGRSEAHWPSDGVDVIILFEPVQNFERDLVLTEVGKEF